MPPISILLIESSEGTRASSGHLSAEGANRAEAFTKLILGNTQYFGLEVRSELAERKVSPLDQAILEFNGEVCPVCEAAKGKKFWFCRDCWDKVKREAKEFRDGLWQRIADVPTISKYYWPAKNWLKQMQGK